MTTTYVDGDHAATTPVTDDDYTDNAYEVDLANERDREPIDTLTGQLAAIADSARTAQRIAQALGLAPTITRPDEGCWYVTWSETVLGSRSVLVQSCITVDEPELRTTIELAGSAWEDEYPDVQELIDALAAAQGLYGKITEQALSDVREAL